jgi:TonB-linked SusC/RagA family outer membrane protein
MRRSILPKRLWTCGRRPLATFNKLFLIFAGVFCFCLSAIAQTKTITGRVTDQNGQPVIGASVLAKGTARGTKSNVDGVYTLSVPANARTLVVSSVNMATREVSISGTTVDVSLTTATTSLEGVIVTALGIQRDKRAIGYASQTIQGEQLANRGEPSLTNALQGKVAGVNITNASGGAGASTNINIRGITSFQGSNQPLFVVDGIPISNDVDRTTNVLGTLGDAQPANRALDIDMNNVESVNILKGPAASVLYGSRASAGAILITTKKGGSAKGKAEVILNSSYGFQNAVGLPKVQNTYGQGAGGVYNPISNNSYGPRFGSTPSIENGLLVGGQPVNYKAYPNNIDEFFRQGTIADNSITINGGDALRNQTFSLSNLSQEGIEYNTALKRTNLRFGANAPVGEKLKIGGSVGYTNTVQEGTPGGNSSGLAVVLGLARSIDLTRYRDSGTYKTPTGANNWLVAGTDNPYFNAFENPVTSNTDRFQGSMNVGFDATEWLNISYRLGGDIYTDRRKQIIAITSQRAPTGQILEQTFFRSEINGDLIIKAEKNGLFTKDLNITGILGQNINQRRFQNTVVQADALAIPGFFNASNATTFTQSGELNTLRRILGYYAQASFNYKNYAFVEFTGRVDQSSTLPKDKNTYFYPAVNTSLVLTDLFGFKSNFLSYAKIRAAYAKVGRDADPYLLESTYGSSAFGNNVNSFSFPFGSAVGFGANSRIGPTELSPEFTSSYEGGVVLQFFRNRVSLDVGYYNSTSKAQIINVTIPPSTGFSTLTTNIGELNNKGWEVAASGSVVRSKNFRWDINTNFTKQENLVVSIADGVDNSAITGNAFNGSIPSYKVGFPYGVFIGGTIPRDPVSGQRIVNPATGTYQPTVAGQVLSDPNPEWQAGLTNTVTYKGFNFGFTLDYTHGGEILSFTAATYKGRGALDITAIDRELPRVIPGVILDPGGSGKYIPNNIQIPGQTYWNTVQGGLQSEFNVYDASVLNIRELTLGYNVPSDIISGMKINGLRFGVFARNVFYYAPNAPINPQLNQQGAGNIRGLDAQGTPNARTIGANLRLTL